MLGSTTTVDRPDVADIQLIDQHSAAQKLGVSVRYLYSVTQPRGVLPAVRFGKSVRYSMPDLLAFVELQKKAEPKKRSPQQNPSPAQKESTEAA